MKLKNIVFSVLLISVFLLSPQTSASDLSYLFKPSIRGDMSDESVYFVMTDRFANGDESNDNGGLPEGRFTSGLVLDEIGWWHGGDFKGITEKMSYIRQMGYSSIWITPPVKQIVFQGSSSSYHGYWGLDFMTVDPHLGTEADFKALVKAAHEIGIKIIIDVVANHTADVIQYKDNQTEYLESNRFPYRDINGKVFTPSKLAGKSIFPKLSATKSFPYKPVLDKSNSKIKNPAWLNDVTNYHNRGNSSFTGESSLDGDFFGLDDLFTEKPNVVNGWIDVWTYWISEFDIDGIRIDTFKHVNADFWKAVIPKIQMAAKKKGKIDFPIFGEVADSDSFSLASYLRTGQTPSVLDFSFQRQVAAYAKFGNSPESLVSLFNADDLYTTSKTNAYQLATFLGNHDMGRIGLQLSKAVGQGQEKALLERALLSNALLFLLRGGPVTYYGDEVGMIGTGGDKEARQDMFSTQVPDWQVEERIGATPIGKLSSFDINHPLRDQITELQRLIRENPALRSGVQEIQFARNGVFGVTRYARGKEYLVLFNASEEKQIASMPQFDASYTWNLLAGDCSIFSHMNIELKPRSYCVVKSNTEIASSSIKSLSLLKPTETPITGNLIQLATRVVGSKYSEVSFSVKSSGQNWQHIGTSDRKTFKDGTTSAGLYRVFLDPLTFKNGVTIDVVALARGMDGKVVRSAIQKFKIKY